MNGMGVRRAKIYERYEAMIRLHLEPALGHIPLQKLLREQALHLLSQELAEGLSPKTVINIHNMLHKALDDAVRWGLVGRNVCDVVSAPRRIRYEIQPLTPEQVRVLLAAVRGHRLEALSSLALATGMRKGELLGSSGRTLTKRKARCRYGA